ncbi:MAG: D-arabino 3-hexulose 6-phosphate aldehyde lyase [Planctomycetota bacterium]
MDCPTIAEALEIARHAVAAGAHWLEAWTGLLMGSGIEGVRALRREFPDHVIVADTKTMDGGHPLSKWPGEAGANYAVIMAAAGDHVIREAFRWRAKGGTKVMVDTMYQPNQVGLARHLEEIGVDYIVLHLGSDERAAETWRRPLDHLEEVRAAIKIPIQVVGGLTLDESLQAFEMGADSVALGNPLVPDDLGPRMRENLQRIVEAANKHE